MSGAKERCALSPYFILLKEQVVRAQSKTALINRAESKDRQVLPGSLFEEVKSQTRHTSPITGSRGDKFVYKSLEHENLVLECSTDNLARISKEEKDLLVGLVQLRERYDIYIGDKRRLAEGLHIKVGSEVHVDVQGLVQRVSGIVRYKGPLPGQSGTHFGIELLEQKGQGTTDGIFRKQRLFKCDEDCGVFVSISKISLVSLDHKKNRKSSKKGDEMKATKDDQIEIGSRVVIFCAGDEGDQAEYGTVRYIGIPKKLAERHIGIELDNPVGSGTGRFDGEKLFQTEKNHAILVPYLAVLPAHHFEEKPKSEAKKRDSSAEAIDVVLKDSAMSKGGLLKEQQQLFKEFEEKKRQDHSSQQHHSYPSDGMTHTHVSKPADVLKALEDKYEHDSDKSEKPSTTQWYVNESDSSIYVSMKSPIYQNSPLLSPTKGAGQARKNLPIELPTSEKEHIYMDMQGNQQRTRGSSGQQKDQLTITGKPKKQIRDVSDFCVDSNYKDKLRSNWRKDISDCSPKNQDKDSYFAYTHNVPVYNKKQPRSPTSPGLSTGQAIAHASLDIAFGDYESPMIDGYVGPPNTLSADLCGIAKGIQGHHNSCYLDSTLYSMFAFSITFDKIILRDKRADDLDEFDEVQKVLREGIVNPLRRNGFVRADRVNDLRKLLDRLGSVSGLTSEEKDPEEFLNTLLQQVCKAEPFLKLKSPNDEEHTSFCYQMFMDKDENKQVPTVQELFEQSFILSDIKLVDVPSCLIVQMPRFGKQYKMYNRIIPSLTLDITDVLETQPRQCTICSHLAKYECRDCNVEKSFVTDQITSYCGGCVERTHQHPKREKHNYKELKIMESFVEFYKENPDVMITRECMELFAVVCIETSHYVAFVKCGTGDEAPWCFFDSMSDRQGEESGFNIPAVTHIKELVNWLGNKDRITKTDEKDMPEHIRRLLCDAYMLFYQSPETLMYK
ncbi:ubiquitin carboxyl-terminal hydrolase CYLD-like [Saccoglossus kowalevskii]|uniref:ubiquitinyl hydrolase 1 n=1 Tax=Saccoglossus kowalevskii TaxID=10224 RepID=A0ABM0LVM7_SACKO|nr:PREDICTED: ubiquitin carboxyl-terminal hydrolase CYLD-like [Saccoglossus kowalevskii]